MSYTGFLSRNAPWLAAGGLLTFLSGFGQTFFISIFAGELRADFGLSHGAWGGLYSLGTAASAVVMVWAGALTDVFRVRVLGPMVLIGLSLACIAMALNPYVSGLPIVIFALRFFGQGMASHVAVVAISRWFVATRGRALSVATLGFAAAEALLPVGFVAMMAMVDWHLLWVVAAAISLCGMPLLMRLLREERTPQSISESQAWIGGNGPEVRPFVILVYGSGLAWPGCLQYRVFLSSGPFCGDQRLGSHSTRGLFPALHILRCCGRFWIRMGAGPAGYGTSNTNGPIN